MNIVVLGPGLFMHQNQQPTAVLLLFSVELAAFSFLMLSFSTCLRCACIFSFLVRRISALPIRQD